MKKVLKWGGIILVVFIIIGALTGSNSSKAPNSNTQEVKKEGTSIETENETPEVKEKLTISNSSVSDKGYGMYEVLGEVTNNDSEEHSGTLRATFYDKDKKILGSAVGAVNDIAPGQTKTFSLMSTDKIDGYDSFKVEVDSMF